MLRQALEDGDYDTLVDPHLHGNYNDKELADMVSCAAACVHHSPGRRLRMSQVTQIIGPSHDLRCSFFVRSMGQHSINAASVCKGPGIVVLPSSKNKCYANINVHGFCHFWVGWVIDIIFLMLEHHERILCTHGFWLCIQI